MQTFIKKYNDYLNENLLSHLKGPSQEDMLRDNPTALLRSVLFQNDELVERALKAGADINFKDGFMLKYCAEHGYLDKVKYLIEHGADVDASEFITDSALTKAARNGHFEVVKYLIENGAGKDVYKRDLKQALAFAKNNAKLFKDGIELRTKYHQIIKYLEDFEWGWDDLSKK